jgi:hypothetical protein
MPLCKQDTVEGSKALGRSKAASKRLVKGLYISGVFVQNLAANQQAAC